MSSSPSVRLVNTETLKQNTLLAEVTKEGKLMLGGKEIRVNYGNEAIADHYELSKLASLINKHYDTKKVFDALFSQPGSGLSLTANGLTDTKDESKKIAVETKGFKGRENTQRHHARKFGEIEQDIKQNLAFSKEIAALSQEFKDDTFKKSVQSLLRDPGVDVAEMLKGSFQWNEKSLAAQLSKKENRAILRVLQTALKTAPKQAQKTDSQECLKKLLVLLKKQNITLASQPDGQSITSSVTDSQALHDAKAKVSAFLTELKVADVDSNLDVTSQVYELKLDESRLQQIRSEVAKLEKAKPKLKTTKLSKNLQLYAYKRLVRQWETYKGRVVQAEPEMPKQSPARILRPRSPRGKV